MKEEKVHRRINNNKSDRHGVANERKHIHRGWKKSVEKKRWQRSWSNGVMRKNKHNEHQMDAVAIASSGFFPACSPRKKRRNKMCNSNEESWLAEKTTAFSWTASSSSCSFYLSSTVGSMHFCFFLHCISFGRLFIPLLKQTEFLDRTFSFSLNVLLVLFFSLVGSAIAPSMYVACNFFCVSASAIALLPHATFRIRKKKTSHIQNISLWVTSRQPNSTNTLEIVCLCVCVSCFVRNFHSVIRMLLLVACLLYAMQQYNSNKLPFKRIAIAVITFRFIPSSNITWLVFWILYAMLLLLLLLL